jgi:antirestriction protein
MTLLFYAQPYDISAVGFYFKSADEYGEQAATLKNSYGDPVEEFEIQFIDGEQIDCELAKAWQINQVNFAEFIEAADDWDDEKKTRFIIAVNECGYSLEQVASDPDAIDIDIYQLDSLKDLAEQFVDEGLFGEIPDRLQSYLDFDAIARDLSVDYSETEIAGQRLIYRCS